MATQARAAALTRSITSQGVWGRRSRVLVRTWDIRLCLIVILGLIVLVALPASIWPSSTSQTNLVDRFAPPSIMGNDSAYPLGADSLGRYVRYRILASTRLTLLIAGLATIISTIAGTIAGLAAGFLGGRTDAVLSRVVDIFLAFPTLLLILALIASVGQSSWAVIGVLALSGWAGYARVIRSATLTQSRREFIEAARCLGATNGQILTRHLLPNIMTPILVLSTLNLASFVLTESAISYLGLGPAPPETTWGGLIGEGRNSIYDAWWVSVFPGIAIVITVMCFGFVGDAVRDAFDPLSHQQGGDAEGGAA